MELPALPTHAEIECAIAGNSVDTLLGNIQSRFLSNVTDTEFDNWIGREYKRVLKAILPISSSNEIYQASNDHISYFLSYINQNPLSIGIIQAISYSFTGNYTKTVSKILINNKKLIPSENESVLKPIFSTPTIFCTFVDGLFHSAFIKNLITQINSDIDSKLLTHIISIFDAFISCVRNEFLVELFVSLYTRIISILRTSSQSLTLIKFLFDYSNSTDAELLDEAIDTILALFNNDNYSFHARIIPIATKMVFKSDREQNIIKLRQIILHCLLNSEEAEIFEQASSIICEFTRSELLKEEDCIEILFKSNVKDTKLKSQLIIQCIQTYKYSCTTIAQALLSEQYIAPDLILFLIDYIPDNDTTTALFNMLLNNFHADLFNVSLKKSPGNRLLQLLIDESKEFNANNFDAVSFILSQYQLKSQICSLIDNLAESAMKNNELFCYFEKCRFLTHHIIDQVTSEYLFNLIVRLIQTNNNSEHLHHFISFVTKWIAETDNSLFLRSIEPLFTMTEIPLTKVYYPLYSTLTAKGVRSPHLLKFLMNIAQTFDQPQYCYWLSKSIIHLLQDAEPIEIEKYVSLMFNMLEIPEKIEIAAKMLFFTTSLSADSILPSKDISCGFNKDFTAYQNNKVRQFSITIHPQHSCRRIYYAYALQLNGVVRHFNLFVRLPNGTKKFINPHFPISSMPLDIDDIALDVVNRNDEDYIDIDADLLYVCSTIIEKIRNNSKILLCRASDSEFIPRILTMIGEYDQYFLDVVPDPENIFIYPFYIRWCVMHDIPINPKELLNRINNRNYGVVGCEIIIECLYDYEDKIVFTVDELKKYLIHNSSDSFRELVVHLGNFENQESVFLSLVSESILPQYRNNTKQFYSIIKNYDINPKTFGLFLTDMKQFEKTQYSPTDETFIGLIKLVGPTTEISNLVFNMLFQMPMFPHNINPFLQTQQSRESAIEYFTKGDAVDHLVRLLQPLPIFNNEPSSLFAFYQHAGIKNEGSTCYAAAVVQCLSSFQQFTCQLFGQENVSEYSQKMRSVLAKVRNIRTNEMSILDYLLEFKTFDKTVQQDACEFFGKALELLEENDGVDMIRDFRGLISTKYEDCEEKEEPFVLLSVKTKGFSNLLDSIKSSFSPEFISDYHHTQKQKYGVTRSSVISKWPKNLVLQLQRWEFDFNLMYRKKLEGYFSFPMSLPRQLLMDLTGTCPDLDYSLSAIIVHVGQAETGHYYALIKEGNEWVCCNDTTISTIDISQIPQYAFGVSSSNSGYIPTGYMLFYTQSNEENIISNIPETLIRYVNSEQKKYWPNYIFNNKQTIGFLSEKFSDITDSGFLIHLILKLKIQTNELPKTAKNLINQTDKYELVYRFVLDHLEKEFPDLFFLIPNNDGQFRKLFKRIFKASDDLESIKFLTNMPKNPENDRFNAFYVDIAASFLAKDRDWSLHTDILRSIIRFLDDAVKLKDKHTAAALFTELCRIHAELLRRGVVTQSVLDIFQMKMLSRFARYGGEEKPLDSLIQAAIDKAPELFLASQENKKVFAKFLSNHMRQRPQEEPADVSGVPQLMTIRSRCPDGVFAALSTIIGPMVTEDKRRKVKRVDQHQMPTDNMTPDQMKPPQPLNQPPMWQHMRPPYGCIPYMPVQYPPSAIPYAPWGQPPPQPWAPPNYSNHITCPPSVQVHPNLNLGLGTAQIYPSNPQVQPVSKPYPSPNTISKNVSQPVPPHAVESKPHAVESKPHVVESKPHPAQVNQMGATKIPQPTVVRRIHVSAPSKDSSKANQKESISTFNARPVVRKFTRHVISGSE